MKQKANFRKFYRTVQDSSRDHNRVFSGSESGCYNVRCKLIKLPGAKFSLKLATRKTISEILHAIDGNMDSVFRIQVSTSTSFRHALHVIEFMATLDKGGLGVILQNPGHEVVFGA